MKKNVLVTGGAGFIGSHLCSFLSNANKNLIVIDDLSSGKNSRLLPETKFIKSKVQDVNTNELPKKIDVIFHLGEYSRVENSFNDPDAVIKNNLNSCSSALKIARMTGAKFIYSGSSTKFGDNGSNKYDSPYALSKYLNTELVNQYCRWFAMKYAIAYFYNVYGPGENATGEFATVIAKFIDRARKHQDLEITLPGSQQRNFTHIDDTVRGLSVIAEKGQGDDYGIASDESYSIIDVAKQISPNITFTPAKRGNRKFAQVNNHKTKQLGWMPQENLNDYIKKQIT